MLKYLFLFLSLGLVFCSKSPDNCYDVNFSYFVSTSPTDSSYNLRAKNVIVKVIDSKNNVLSDTTDSLGRFNIIGNVCFPYRARVESLDGTKFSQMQRTVSDKEGCKNCHYPNGSAGGYIYFSP
jgi:hypothetical protein